jgi:nucleoside-diphosphate-sugar epimerase
MVPAMRVFMTGATGYIGGAVATELRHHGHEVTALVRPNSEARHLRDLGVVIVAGDLESLPSLGDTLKGHDSYINTAFSPQHDRQTIDTLAPYGGQFIYTAGVWAFSNTTSADETTTPDPLKISAWRVEHEQIVLRSPSRAVIRPGCVYGGKQSLLASWFAAVDQRQPIELAGDGSNHWSMINLHDLANCYVSVVEQRAGGLFHATDDTRETLAECARALAPDVEIRSTTPDQVREKFGEAFAEALLVNQQVKSDITRERLGWTPKRTFTSSIDEQWREWREIQAAGR